MEESSSRRRLNSGRTPGGAEGFCERCEVDLMYQKGELVFYGTMGVCRVLEIDSRPTPGSKEEQLYYTLEAVYQQCTIRTPVHNEKVFMRTILSKEEAQSLIDQMPFLHAEICQDKAAGELAHHYQESIQTHTCLELARLAMSIYAKKKLAEEHKRKLGAVDERFLKKAEDLLFGELAAALGIEREKVPDYIAHRLEGLQGPQAPELVKV